LIGFVLSDWLLEGFLCRLLSVEQWGDRRTSRLQGTGFSSKKHGFSDIFAEGFGSSIVVGGH
jgi:hypothetical protein